jgi:hypothetical protein
MGIFGLNAFGRSLSWYARDRGNLASPEKAGTSFAPYNHSTSFIAMHDSPLFLSIHTHEQ